ncbi:hypothetical protein [Kitasatospora sp. NPDC094011]|uniref:hypothetical protein n=1 Tax=Kitasatospora sp. NPDC094011 TaxID=3364090 RepID=UPI00382EE9D0
MSAGVIPEGYNLVWSGGLLEPRTAAAVEGHTPPPEIRGLHWVSRSRVKTLTQPAQTRRILDAWDAWEHGAGRPFLLSGVPAPLD